MIQLSSCFKLSLTPKKKAQIVLDQQQMFKFRLNVRFENTFFKGMGLDKCNALLHGLGRSSIVYGPIV